MDSSPLCVFTPLRETLISSYKTPSGGAWHMFVTHESFMT